MIEEPVGIAVSELVLGRFLRVVTHPKVFREPFPLAVSLDFAKDLRTREGVRSLSPGHTLGDFHGSQQTGGCPGKPRAGCLSRGTGGGEQLRVDHDGSGVLPLSGVVVEASAG